MHVERADDVVAVMVACAAAYGHLRCCWALLGLWRGTIDVKTNTGRSTIITTSHAETHSFKKN